MGLPADIGATIGEQLAEDRAMAAGLVLAIAADGEVCLVGEGGEQVEEVGRFRLLHLGAKFPLEGLPAAGVVAGFQGNSHQAGRGRQRRQPDIVEAAFGEVGFGDAAGRTADGADAQAFLGQARGAEANDGEGHDGRVQRSAVSG